MEMQCYCEQKKHLFEPLKNIDIRKCQNNIPYVNHHDWGKPEHYMCADCIDNCEDN